MAVEQPQASATAAIDVDAGASRLKRTFGAALRLLSPAAEPSFEQKFVFTPHHLAYVRAHLDRVLRPDPSYEEGRISSVYYDTPSLELYHEKRASEYLKTKVRLRW